LHNRCVVDQEFNRDQHVIDEDGVIGRQAQRAVRAVFPEGMRGDVDGVDPVRLRMAAAIDAAMADPGDAGGGAVEEGDGVAWGKVLDWDGAGWGGDAGALGEAGDGRRRDGDAGGAADGVAGGQGARPKSLS
jgi:hypothetical protein